MKKDKEMYQYSISSRKYSIIYPLLLIIILLIITGCTPTTPPADNGWDDLPSHHKIEGIPLVKQTIAGTSFSVAAEMAFKSLGVNVDCIDLLPIIQIGSYQNIDALTDYAKDLGFNAGPYYIDLGDLLHLIHRDVRMVAQTKFSIESPAVECRVPTAYDISKEKIYLNDPWTGSEITISFDDFSGYSYEMDNLNGVDRWTGVLIYPENVSIEDLNLAPFSYSDYY